MISFYMILIFVVMPAVTFLLLWRHYYKKALQDKAEAKRNLIADGILDAIGNYKNDYDRLIEKE